VEEMLKDSSRREAQQRTAALQVGAITVC
jgi:hypothetical protein